MINRYSAGEKRKKRARENLFIADACVCLFLSLSRTQFRSPIPSTIRRSRTTRRENACQMCAIDWLRRARSFNDQCPDYSSALTFSDGHLSRIDNTKAQRRRRFSAGRDLGGASNYGHSITRDHVCGSRQILSSNGKILSRVASEERERGLSRHRPECRLESTDVFRPGQVPSIEHERSPAGRVLHSVDILRSF